VAALRLLWHLCERLLLLMPPLQRAVARGATTMG